MAQATRLSCLVALGALGIGCGAQVTPPGSATPGVTGHGPPELTKIVVLQCTGFNQEFRVRPKPKNHAVVIFTTPRSCPLTTFDFDPGATGFTSKTPDPDGNVWYDYDGTAIKVGYTFKYTTGVNDPQSRLLGGGTGVIKN